MDSLFIIFGSQEWEVDVEKTTDEYHRLIINFIDSDLFSFNPYDLSNGDLDAILNKRKDNGWGASWIESTNMFYSRCLLQTVNHVDSNYPWDQLYFQPYTNFPVVTINRFRREVPVLIHYPYSKLRVRKKYEILGCHEDTTSLHYFTQNIGTSFIFCYRFPVFDDYSIQPRSCLRSAEDSYKREALLKTQSFVISYFINHPLEYLPHPYLAKDCMECERVVCYEAMSIVLSPILEEHKAALISLESRFGQETCAHNLIPEVI